MGIKIYLDFKKKNLDITSYLVVIAYNCTSMKKMANSSEISQQNTELGIYEINTCYEIDLPANDVTEDMTSIEIITDISKQPIHVYQIYKNKITLAQAVK